MSYTVLSNFQQGETFMTEKVITFRIELETKHEFEKIAKKIDQTPSQLLRNFIRDFVQHHEKKGKK